MTDAVGARVYKAARAPEFCPSYLFLLHWTDLPSRIAPAPIRTLSVPFTASHPRNGTSGGARRPSCLNHDAEIAWGIDGARLRGAS